MALRKFKFWLASIRGLLALGCLLFVTNAPAAWLGHTYSYHTTEAEAQAHCVSELNAKPSIQQACSFKPYGTYNGNSPPKWSGCYYDPYPDDGCIQAIITGDCPTGQSWDPTTLLCAANTETQDTCEVGTRKTFTNNQSSNPADLAPTICGTDGCKYVLDDELAFGLPSLGRSSGQYTATSTSCTASIDAPTEETVLPGKQCAEDAYGNKICIEPQATNCGEFNGHEFCAEDIPTTGTCTLLGAGGFICDGTAEPPLNTDGTAQHEVADVTDGTNDAKIYDAAGGKDAQGIAEGNEDAVIDETGTPTGTDDMFGGALDGTGIDGYIDGLGGEGEGGGVTGGGGSISLDLGLPQSATCTSISFSFQGTPVVFPGTDGCDKLDKWKDIIGWFLYCATAIYLVRVATRKPA